jgi:hypothetical protein
VGRVAPAIRKANKPPRETSKAAVEKRKQDKIHFFKKETNLMNATAVKSAATAPEEAGPARLLKRIGSTTYEVTIHFSETEKETAGEKLLRVIGREVEKSA